MSNYLNSITRITFLAVTGSNMYNYTNSPLYIHEKSKQNFEEKSKLISTKIFCFSIFKGITYATFTPIPQLIIAYDLMMNNNVDHINRHFVPYSVYCKPNVQINEKIEN